MASKFFAKKVWLDGYCFDSEQEAEYYKVLKEREKKGEIGYLHIHPTFVLQEAFDKDDMIFSGIYYEADFRFLDYKTQELCVNNVDEEYTRTVKKERIVDVKGFVTDEFAIKQKLFEKRYPEYHLEVVAKDIDGQFKPIDEVKKNRKERKKQRKANKKEKEWAEYDTLKLKLKRTPKQEARLSELAITYANKKHRKVKAK